MMLINKSYFPEYIQFTLNVPDSQVQPYINNAETQDIVSAIGDQMYAALRLIYDTNPTLWDSATAYSAGEFTIIQNGIVKQVYEAIQANTNSNPITNPSDWQLSELGSFFEQYIKPWGVLVCAKEFLTFHGVNVTQFGLRVADETTSFAVDGNTRAAMLANVNNRANAYYNKMRNRLCDVNWTFDNTVYKIDCEIYKIKPNRFSVNPL